MIRTIFRVLFSRILLFAISFAAAVGVPVLTFNSDWRKAAWDKVQQVQSNWKSGEKKSWFSWKPKPDAPNLAPVVQPETGDDSVPPAQLAGAQVRGLHEIFHWGITPQYVTSRWTRVSTAYDEPAMDGMRVPVSTGFTPNDLAGSLTYYFDEKYQLKRITFDGTVGNPSQAVNYLAGRFGLRKEPRSGLELYLSKWNGYPTSALRIERASVYDVTRPHQNMDVMLELNRPTISYGLSQRFRSTLVQDGVIRK